MVATDEAILSFMHSLLSDSYTEVAVSPMVVYINLAVTDDIIEKGSGTVARRMRLMSHDEIALIRTVPDVKGTYYVLTQLGIEYLNDTHDPAELVPPDDFGVDT
jgi:tRNA(Arg) A34 adenosine deaminase TadA